MSEDPLAFRVFNEIGIIDQLASNRLERVLPAGLTLSQFIVLNHFVRLGGERSPARLANAFQVTKQTMTSTLGRLQRGGLVDIRANPRDGRAKIVTITERGIATRHACIAALGPVVDHYRTLIGDVPFEALLPGLIQLRIALDADR